MNYRCRLFSHEKSLRRDYCSFCQLLEVHCTFPAEQFYIWLGHFKKKLIVIFFSRLLEGILMKFVKVC